MNIQQIKHRYGIIGTSRALNTAVEIGLQVAPTDVTVLITGENGTGKDVFSRIIHQFSKRKHSNYIAINCGAIPQGTLESELFGHERGAFTSAYEARKGYFEEVEGGTIFLDEIAEMPMETQARLLRLLENGEYYRVGSSKARHADVRVIAATNKNLLELIRQGKFREDLFFRLNTVTIQVPPLRNRGDDIELLFKYFALEFSDKYRRDPILLEEEAVPLLYKYRWPGNVRELRNLVEKLTVLVKGDMVSPETLQSNLLIQERYLPSIVRSNDFRSFEAEESSPQEVAELKKLIFELGKEVAELKNAIYREIKGRPSAAVASGDYRPMRYPQYDDIGANYDENGEIYPLEVDNRPPMIEESLSLARKERELIAKALEKHGSNRKKAAQELEISERTLYRKIKNYDLA